METPKPHQGYEWYNLLVARSLVPGTVLLPPGEAGPESLAAWPGILDCLCPTLPVHQEKAMPIYVYACDEVGETSARS